MKELIELYRAGKAFLQNALVEDANKEVREVVVSLEQKLIETEKSDKVTKALTELLDFKDTLKKYQLPDAQERILRIMDKINENNLLPKDFLESMGDKFKVKTESLYQDKNQDLSVDYLFNVPNIENINKLSERYKPKNVESLISGKKRVSSPFSTPSSSRSNSIGYQER